MDQLFKCATKASPEVSLIQAAFKPNEGLLRILYHKLKGYSELKIRMEYPGMNMIMGHGSN
ncbi:hypothetical protein LCGC14_0447490 [marine sediment metagenome]|uniref:Uncharacterized protein n=1 Tax=marine sediment metagenome TaxID=412755 RepID=A0A0F9SPD9_9ZZZZ